ncbi:MAG: hypothetical protein ABI540_10660 [Spartobacteria bacterium]
MSFPLSNPFRCLMLLGVSMWVLAFGSGCAVRARHAVKPPPRPGTIVIGEIAVVDEEKRFVLVDLDSSLYVPAPGEELRSTNAAGETAHLKASPEQKRPFIAADIIDGEPAVGDKVAR